MAESLLAKFSVDFHAKTEHVDKNKSRESTLITIREGMLRTCCKKRILIPSGQLRFNIFVVEKYDVTISLFVKRFYFRYL
jgi:hypothetical protein